MVSAVAVDSRHAEAGTRVAAVRRCRLTLAYDGSHFLGAQRQARGRTVAGDVEAALSAVVGHEARLTLAGRTDRGVHATGQVAHVDLRTTLPMPIVRRAVNAQLATDVVVTQLEAVEAQFHARFDAKWREYRYRVWHSATRSPRYAGTAWHWSSPLDDSALNSGADALLGTHDYAGFATHAQGGPEAQWPRSSVREVYGSRWGRLPGDDLDGGSMLEYRVRANGFLPKMARTLVGALMLVGSRQRSASWIAELLVAGERRFGPSPAPACGLTLARVGYGDEPRVAPWQAGFGIGPGMATAAEPAGPLVGR